MKKYVAALSGIGLWLMAQSVHATSANPLPEPGVLGLLIAGGIVGAVIVIRKRRK